MSSTASNTPEVGTVLADRYKLVRLIARGGMGDVYEADDGVLRRRVAVKMYRGDALVDRTRFDAEVHLLAGLSHPGLVRVFDAGERDDEGYVVLELIEGPSLQSMLKDRTTLPAVEVRDMGVAMSDALAYVHDAGVVHRDVTPSNILFGVDGRPRLADFGIARLVDGTRLTAVSHTIGTVAYMAPEQVEGANVTPAADVYALGLVLLEALTGRAGFEGVGHEVALARLARDPDVATGVPPGWQGLLREMTARVPSDRPTAAALPERFAALSMTAEPDPASARTVAVAVGSAVVDGFTHTEVVPIGGTAVMPALPVTDAPAGGDEHAAARAVGFAFARWRRPLAVAAVVSALLIIVAFATANDHGANLPTSTTLAPAAVTVPTTTPTTTPPTTTPPRAGGKGSKGHGD